MIGLDDMAMFSVWDGYMVAVFLVTMGVIARVAGKLVPRFAIPLRAGSILLLLGAAGLVTAAVEGGLPDRAVGVWGVLAGIGAVLLIPNAIHVARTGKPLL